MYLANQIFLQQKLEEFHLLNTIEVKVITLSNYLLLNKLTTKNGGTKIGVRNYRPPPGIHRRFKEIVHKHRERAGNNHSVNPRTDRKARGRAVSVDRINPVTDTRQISSKSNTNTNPSNKKSKKKTMKTGIRQQPPATTQAIATIRHAPSAKVNHVPRSHYHRHYSTDDDEWSPPTSTRYTADGADRCSESAQAGSPNNDVDCGHSYSPSQDFESYANADRKANARPPTPSPSDDDYSARPSTLYPTDDGYNAQNFRLNTKADGRYNDRDWRFYTYDDRSNVSQARLVATTQPASRPHSASPARQGFSASAISSRPNNGDTSHGFSASTISSRPNSRDTRHPSQIYRHQGYGSCGGDDRTPLHADDDDTGCCRCTIL